MSCVDRREAIVGDTAQVQGWISLGVGLSEASNQRCAYRGAGMASCMYIAPSDFLGVFGHHCLGTIVVRLFEILQLSRELLCITA